MNRRPSNAVKRPVLLPDESEINPSPPLKWAGGKRWLVPRLETIWRPHSERRLVEPFCGGLAVALGLKPTDALLNDVNPHLINFYQKLQKGMVVRSPYKNDSDIYYRAREKFNDLIRLERGHFVKAAQLFYYLNRTGYNGLCRFNNQGYFNVPFGRYKHITYTTDFRHYQSTLKPWKFTSRDFSELTISDNDFVYADPPYDVPFVNYSQNGFNWQQQEKLAEWLASLPCPVVASNQATDRIIKLYQSHGFDIEILDAPRRISCTGDRASVKEILATKGF